VFIAGNVRHSKAGLRNALQDCFGENQPLVQIGIGRPGLGIANRRTESICLITNLEVLQFSTKCFGDKLSFSGRKFWRICSQIDAIQTRPSRGIQEGTQVMNRLRGDSIGEIWRRIACLVGTRFAGWRS
jgi:hypothetical protein